MDVEACAHELHRRQTIKPCLLFRYQSAPVHLLGAEIVQVLVNGEQGNHSSGPKENHKTDAFHLNNQININW
jgi:hypothetical protein